MLNAISIDITNHCNFDCIHCLRDKRAPRRHMALDVLEEILRQVSSVGIHQVCLTGGEATLHPGLEEVFDLLVAYGMEFNLVSNGYLFVERVFSLLNGPRRAYFTDVCFSLDGATAGSHDMLRRERGSFRRTLQAIRACIKRGIPVSVKSVIHRENMTEVSRVAFLCASLGVRDLGFVILTPTPRLESAGLMPSDDEYREVIAYVKGRVIPSFSMEIGIEGYADTEMKIPFCNPARGLSVDHEGNLIFCCNLSHPTAGDRPDEFGREFLGNLCDIGIEEGIVRHYRVFGWFVREVLKRRRSPATPSVCGECLELFGKMDWRRK